MNYEYSFSGTDVRAFAEQDSNVFSLNSLATISFQVNEQKSPVRRLGRQGVVGFTRSIKTIAGTMVFVILKGHPLKDLMPNNTLTQRYKEINTNMPFQATNILPFNLRLKYKTEHSSTDFSELFIEGIEIISQSIVTSVNDMITELVVQFMGRDYKEFYSNIDSSSSTITTQKDLDNDLQLQEDNKDTQINNYNKRLQEIEIEKNDFLTQQQELDSYGEEKKQISSNNSLLDDLILSTNKKYDISNLPTPYLTSSFKELEDFNSKNKRLAKIIEELKGMKYNLEKNFSLNSLAFLENNSSSMIEKIDKDILFFTLEKQKNDQKLLS